MKFVGLVVAIVGCSSASAGNAPDEKAQATADVGAQAVKSRNCVGCHGQNMAGGTQIPYPADPRVELYPPNLTPDPGAGVGAWTDLQLANAIRNGVDRDEMELCPQMKHFSTMSDYEVYSIVKYLKSIPPVSQKVLRSVCPPLKTKDEQQRQ
jgi:fructose 5-dehydrogenase cytochrome subunit